jgi:6-pyruvoyltetrahydropterin/6-carboxytetrahydropterin synthase
MFRVTRRYEFAASHRLYTPQFSDDENRRVYGKCANPFGHGHNYVLEVSARGPSDPVTGLAVSPTLLDRLVNEQVISAFDHRNLNLEVEAFKSAVPTAENIAREIVHRLRANWDAFFPGPWPRLDRVRIAETANNTFEIGANEIE